MITSWHMVPLCIGTKQISEIEVKFDITHCGSRGYAPIAVLVEDLDGHRGNSLVRIEADGTVAGTDHREQSLLGPTIISAASHYYSANRAEVLKGLGLTEAAE